MLVIQHLAADRGLAGLIYRQQLHLAHFLSKKKVGKLAFCVPHGMRKEPHERGIETDEFFFQLTMQNEQMHNGDLRTKTTY